MISAAPFDGAQCLQEFAYAAGDGRRCARIAPDNFFPSCSLELAACSVLPTQLFDQIAFARQSCRCSTWQPLASRLSKALISVREEINALLNRLANSGCQFNRNGSWYTPVDAKTHLTRKLDYLVEKNRSGAPNSSSTWPPVPAAARGKIIRCDAAPSRPSPAASGSKANCKHCAPANS